MKSEKKLVLNKETLRQLDPKEAQGVAGGFTLSQVPNCPRPSAAVICK